MPVIFVRTDPNLHDRVNRFCQAQAGTQPEGMAISEFGRRALERAISEAERHDQLSQASEPAKTVEDLAGR